MSGFASAGIEAIPAQELPVLVHVPGAATADVVARLEQLGVWGAAIRHDFIARDAVAVELAGDAKHVWVRAGDAARAHPQSELADLLATTWPGTVVGDEADELRAATDVDGPITWVVVAHDPPKAGRRRASELFTTAVVDGCHVLGLDGGWDDLSTAVRAGRPFPDGRSIELTHSTDSGYVGVAVRHGDDVTASYEWDLEWTMINGADPDIWGTSGNGSTTDELAEALGLDAEATAGLREQMGLEAPDLPTLLSLLDVPPSILAVLVGRTTVLDLPGGHRLADAGSPSTNTGSPSSPAPTTSLAPSVIQEARRSPLPIVLAVIVVLLVLAAILLL